MKYDGFKWKCKISADGRLYNGAWIHKSVMPEPLPEDEITFDEFPETDGGGADYIWDGKTLLYSPQQKSEENEEEITYG